MNTEKGKWGEKEALNFLVGKGHQVLERNYRTKLGELDIVTLYEGMIYCIEVKSWRNSFVHPLEVMTERKIAKMKLIAKSFFYSRKIPEENYLVNICLLYVTGDGIEFFTDLL